MRAVGNIFGFFIVLITAVDAMLYAQNDSTGFTHSLQEDAKPWTDKPFYNHPENFQFAIVSDRTGGHREGVFGKGIEKINLLYPEFVMSVGDLIEGYSTNPAILNEQWSEFHGILDSLSTRFFYVAGNHDYSNSVMAKQWKQRFGKDYYHFIYKDVLFLIMNTNDGDGVLMGKDQIEFLKTTISKNSDVRWTMIFMHHPMWAYGEANGFSEVEAALEDRKYTVFAGHTHRYLHEVRNDQNHYVLGTTGGGSKLRGPKFGEFDHIGWVTMTESGPQLANLALSGIMDHDISNLETKAMATSLIGAAHIRPLVLTRDKERKIILLLNNSSDKTLHFTGRFYHHHQVEPDLSRLQMSLSPKSSRQIEIKTHPIKDFDNDEWDPLELEWELRYDSPFMETGFSLNGTEIIELNPSKPPISMTEQNIFLKDIGVEAAHPYENIAIKYTIDGSAPTLNSSTFSSPLLVNQTTKVKTILSDLDGFESNIFEMDYEKVIPASASKTRNLKKGLAFSYYEGNFISVPDFKKLTAGKTGYVTQLDPDKVAERLDHYAIQYTGYIKILKSGIYTFYLKSDDGSKLFLNEKLVINNDGSHSAVTKKGMIALKKGFHAIRIDYFEDFLEQELELYYTRGDMEKSPVLFWH